MYYRVSLFITGLLFPSLLLAQSCESFSTYMQTCQPFACEEVSALDMNDKITRTIVGQSNNGCQYVEKIETDKTVNIQCKYDEEDQTDKAEKYLELRKGLFKGNNIVNDFFIDDFAESCSSNFTINNIKQFLLPGRDS